MNDDLIARGKASFESGQYTPQRHQTDPFGVDGAHGEVDKPKRYDEEPDPYAGVPPPQEPPDRGDEPAAPTTWEPVNLGPILAGTMQLPQTCIGLHRNDGTQLIYPGREHAVIGDTESGKTWLACACVATEQLAGHHVVYIHYEESGEAGAIGTVERLRLLGVDDDTLRTHFKFVGPTRAALREWLDALLEPPPTLVVHDGVNEAMSLHGHEIRYAEGASEFRRRLVVPCLQAGAATLACDHLPMSHDGARRDAYGSVHKGAALNGARILLENFEPFGRGQRGASRVYVTKDRPGYLRGQGKRTKVPGKTFMGVLAVDDATTFEPFSLAFYAPRDEDEPAATASALTDTVFQVIADQPGQQVASLRALYALMRAADHKFAEALVRNAVDDLVLARQLAEVEGKNRSKGFKCCGGTTG